jgi:hypothetical protein
VLGCTAGACSWKGRSFELLPHKQTLTTPHVHPVTMLHAIETGLLLRNLQLALCLLQLLMPWRVVQRP